MQNPDYKFNTTNTYGLVSTCLFIWNCDLHWACYNLSRTYRSPNDLWTLASNLEQVIEEISSNITLSVDTHLYRHNPHRHTDRIFIEWDNNFSFVTCNPVFLMWKSRIGFLRCRRVYSCGKFRGELQRLKQEFHWCQCPLTTVQILLLSGMESFTYGTSTNQERWLWAGR